MHVLGIYTVRAHLQVFNLSEAVKMHRENHHPTMMGLSNSYVKAFIELDMTADKKVRDVYNSFLFS